MGSNNTQNINVMPYDFDLKSLLDLYKQALKLEFACHHVGTIQTFYPDEQTADATINYTKTYQQIDGNGNISVITDDYTVLVQCPVIVLGGGDGALTFPIQSGDECLIIFNDRDFGGWFTGSSSSAPPTGRLHSISDGICLVGLRSQARALTDYDSTAVTLKMATSFLKIAAGLMTMTVPGTTVTNDGSSFKIDAGDGSGTLSEFNAAGTIAFRNGVGELLNIIDSLLQDIQSATVATLLGPQPLIMPTFAAHLTEFESFLA